MEAVKTLKLRMAREVNFVWNYCNETSSRAIRDRYKFLSAFDLQKLTAGYSKFELKARSFAQDARGRWYLNVCVKVQPQKSEGTEVIGIDLGLKTAATCSDGTGLASGTYRRHEAALAGAQRAHKKRCVRAL